MTTPIVTENRITLEVVIRDDFADEPAPAPAQPRADRRPVRSS
jgi:hypothetical protein